MREPVDPDNLLEGTMVDCWRVVRQLGGGAYGTVYLVEKDGELYALKMARFLRHSGDKRRTDERAQRELNCLLSLQHRHIVQARSYGRWPHAKTGFFYVVMDYVEGSTLAEWVERTHPTPHEMVVLFNKVLLAVAYSHAQGILHRDLKPNNILVEARTGEPVVVDFGAAHFPLPTEPKLTDMRLPPGTPRYTSPEARRFENVHRLNPEAHYEYKAADELYALGVTLFDLLTDPLHHTRPQPKPLGGLDVPQAQEENARVPRALSQFVAKLLQSEPTKRPVSVEAARRELAEFLPLQGEAWTERPVHAPLRPPSEAEEAGPPSPQAPELVSSHEEVSPEPVAEGEPPPQVPREDQREESVAQGEREQVPLEPREQQREEPVLLAEPVPLSPRQQEAAAPGPGVPAEQVQLERVSPAAPPADTPPRSASHGVPAHRWPRSRAVAVSTLVLGLLLGWGVQRSLWGAAHQEPAPAPPAAEKAAQRPSPSQAEDPPPAPASTASPLPHQPLPQPLVAPPVSIPEKGTAVNVRSSSEGAVPSLCAQKQPPPRGTPQWRKWCKCAAIVGSLAATQAGCPAVQVRQSLTEECSKESVEAMKRLEIEIDERLSIELDVKQPSNSNKVCDHGAPGGLRYACIQEGPLTSRVLNGSGKLVHGTLLAGHAWLKPPSGYRAAIFRWTEATLPDGTKHPVCIEGVGNWKYCPNGASQNCAAKDAYAHERWRFTLTPRK
jgi:serine/threonine protein kinase